MTLLTLEWDLERVNPGTGERTIEEQISEAILHIDETIRELETRTGNDSILKMVEKINRVQALFTKVFEWDEYIICQSSINVHDSQGQALNDLSNKAKAKMNTLLLVFGQYLENIPEEKWGALIQQPETAGVELFLTEQKRKVKDHLDSDLEKVIHSLSVHGFDGWEDHYEQEFAQLTVPVDNEEVPFNLAYIQAMLSDDRRIRQEISTAVKKVCSENEERFASIFNHFAGFRNELYQLRGWSNPLKEMLEQNRISEASVNSMMQTLRKANPMLRGYFKRKAQLLHVDKLSWYDIYAPTFTSKTTLTYDKAAEIVTGQFYKVSNKMGRFAERAFNEGWIDAAPSDDKRHGAFCASFPESKESRILLSFTGNYQDVVTIAHELGHAYHNAHLHTQSGFSHHAGTGLAETASTFAENLVLDAAIDLAETREDRLSLLEMKILNGLKYIAYIPAKFEFELQFYKKLNSQRLSAAELVDLMKRTEKDWLQDSLEEVNGYHWMTIPHFYSAEKAFYNLPYTIGYMFSNGIYSSYLADKEAFPERYDDLLVNSGNQTMEQLSTQFLNQGLNSNSFWEDAVRPLEEAVDTYIKETEDCI
ncbi:M3 family oligoendopeptidase [Halobacillus sp. A5]|uniref:M3 family oligoendopeptidase n=1 Tax=Halobacillus sp. A5 TaxID=2880263 RepID=UPI0020A6750C|nr:M3 family oligoendopeptidase [Halobacillus sp. A5]MCP3027766.1 M3 family oligoendopeptidase [Halobacillus sp. A5]